jgi:transposase
VPGRTGKVYADWIAAREQAWPDAIEVAALDPFRGYAVRHEAPTNRVG